MATTDPASRKKGRAPWPADRKVAAVLAGLCFLAVLGVSVAYALVDPEAKRDGRDALDEGLAAAEGEDRPDPADRDRLLEGGSRATLWVVLLVLLAAGWTCTGRAFSDSWAAIVVGRTNRLSLSQVQFTLWTLLFASAVLALFVIRFRLLRDSDALGFSLPTEAALLMGISSASFGGAQLINAGKRGKSPSPKDLEKAVRTELKAAVPGTFQRVKKDVPFGDLFTPGGTRKGGTAAAGSARPRVAAAATTRLSRGDLSAIEAARDRVLGGLTGVLVREEAGSARLVHLVQGEELTNRDHLDLGKTQLLFFTAVALLAYALLLWRLFRHGEFYDDLPGPFLGHLPPVSEGLAALLGASHLGYLGGKAAGTTNQA